MFAMFVAATLATARGVAMTPSGQSRLGHCQIIGGDKLPAATGGSAAICAEVERAIAARAPKVRYSAEVRVLSTSRLAATLVVNGRALPEQKFAVMDRELSQATIKRFAEALAIEIEKAAEP